MQHVIQGLRAGALAGLLLLGIIFVDYGPATNLSVVASWFALDGHSWCKVIGAILLVALGAIFGGVFGAIVRRSGSLLQSLLAGLATGLCWWIVFILLLSTAIMNIHQSPYGTMFWLTASLLYGLALGSLYRQFQEQEARYKTRTV